MSEMESFNWQPFYLSFALASITTLVLWVIGIPLVYWLHFMPQRWKPIVKTVISLPLVLPPSVLGYYLLLAFRPAGWLGKSVAWFFDVSLAFSFQGLVVGSVIFSLPFALNPFVAALETLPSAYQEASFTLGKSKWVTFCKVLLPNVKGAVFTGGVMSFAHTLGEFGVVLLIGGSIPNETRVASIAIYDEVERMNYQQADVYALVLLGCSFLFLLLIYLLNGKQMPYGKY